MRWLKPLWMLPSLPLFEKSHLPPLPGLYYVVSGTKVLYVGKAVSIRLRWNSSRYGDHHKLAEIQRYPDARIYWRTVQGERLRSHLEALEIRRCKPLLNRRQESPDRLWQLWDRLTDFALVGTLAYFLWRLLTP